MNPNIINSSKIIKHTPRIHQIDFVLQYNPVSIDAKTATFQIALLQIYFGSVKFFYINLLVRNLTVSFRTMKEDVINKVPII